MCCDSDSPPAYTGPSYDPEMAKVAREQLAFNERVYAESQPRQQQLYQMAQDIARSQLGDAQTARDRSDVSWGDWNRLGRPLQEQVVGEATTYGGAADQGLQAGMAVADVNTQIANQRGQSQRMAASMGRKYATAPGDDIRGAGLAAAAATGARTAARDKGIALRSGALSGMTGQQNVAGQNLGMGANIAGAGLSSANTGFMSGLPYAQMMNQGYGGAQSGLQGAGSLANQRYGQQLQAWNMEASQPSVWGTLAGIAGTAAGGFLGTNAGAGWLSGKMG